MTNNHLAENHYTIRSVSDILFMLDNAECELQYAKHRLKNYEATLEYRKITYGSGGETIERIAEEKTLIAVLNEKIITLKWLLNKN